jgi:hypothetical protein
MGHLPENALGTLRTPAQALADLLAKFHRSARNHPDLPRLARMIQELAEEIALRAARVGAK